MSSATVLKDASAASIYGACTADGVIVITTKSGSYKTAFWGGDAANGTPM
ncbi:MAG: hypothetical protein IPL27_25100 [Lewinellaceae bacterium]|nr:hypothetical protein [Lewinellaceae bacterium]